MQMKKTQTMFSYWNYNVPLQIIIKKNSVGNWELRCSTLIRQNNVPPNDALFQ